jgi:hypothetical protein
MPRLLQETTKDKERRKEMSNWGCCNVPSTMDIIPVPLMIVTVCGIALTLLYWYLRRRK